MTTDETNTDTGTNSEGKNIGVDAWMGNSVSAAHNTPKVELSSDMTPLSGKSVTSVPEEHRFDRVPPPMTNVNPDVPFLPPGEALDRLRSRMADRARRSNVAPQEAALNTNSGPEAGKSLDALETGVEASPEYRVVAKSEVLAQVKGGVPAALYDATVIPLLEKGLARLDFSPSDDDGISKIIATSTKDGQPLRVVGYARGTRKNLSIN